MTCPLAWLSVFGALSLICGLLLIWSPQAPKPYDELNNVTDDPSVVPDGETRIARVPTPPPVMRVRAVTGTDSIEESSV